MRMTNIEKRFVNGLAHSQRVAAAAVQRLRAVQTRPGLRYLDVGCGNGAAALEVARALGLDVTGVDLDPGQVELARQAARTERAAEFLVADATFLPFDDGSFDIVATNKTLHHLAAWEAAIVEFARVLRPGGHLVIADLVAPRWVAAVLGRLAPGHRPASAEALRRVARTLALDPVRESCAALAFEAVWRKSR